MKGDGNSLEYLIKQYPLERGALEIQYIEEFFGEFPRKKTADEITRRLQEREFLILMAEAPLPDDPGTVVPVSFKVVHQLHPGVPVVPVAESPDATVQPSQGRSPSTTRST